VRFARDSQLFVFCAEIAVEKLRSTRNAIAKIFFMGTPFEETSRCFAGTY
jgi:hypothetical protein